MAVVAGAAASPARFDRLATVRFASARYSVPALVGQIVEVIASDQQIIVCHGDEEVPAIGLSRPGGRHLRPHYGGPRRAPARAVQPANTAEKAFLALGPVAEGFLRAAAAAGTGRGGPR